MWGIGLGDKKCHSLVVAFFVQGSGIDLFLPISPVKHRQVPC